METTTEQATQGTTTGTTWTRRALLRQLDQFAKPTNKEGLLVTAKEYGLYLAFLAAVLFAPVLWVKIVASILAGSRLAMFYTLFHDAAHRTLVANTKLNYFLALALGLPTAQNYRVMVIDHGSSHHQKTNAEEHGFYRPLSVDEYNSMGWMRQRFEQFVRAPNVVGFMFNFLITSHIPERLFPNAALPKQFHRSAWQHFAGVVLFQAGFVALLGIAPHFAPVTLSQALILGWIVPFLTFFTIMGASLYVMHTHPRVPFFIPGVKRARDFAPELCAIHLKMPDFLSHQFANVFAHSAHHAHAGIPCYRLLEAQKHFDAVMGDRALVEPMSLAGFLTTMRVCKLYDYEKHQWLDFEGKPTATAIDLTARGSQY